MLLQKLLGCGAKIITSVQLLETPLAGRPWPENGPKRYTGRRIKREGGGEVAMTNEHCCGWSRVGVNE